MRFELDRLVDFSDAEMIAEVRRVAGVLGKSTMTKGEFNRSAKVAAVTLVRRFGSWEAALKAADLGHLYSGRTVSTKMRSQGGRDFSTEQVIAELQRVAQELRTDALTREQLDQQSSAISYGAVVGRFGTWGKALQAAGLRLTSQGRRYSDDEYFENLLTVWTLHGRPPKAREMSAPPSTIPSRAYEHKWGRWTLALHAFIERVNADQAAPSSPPPPSAPEPAPRALVPEEDQHAIRIGLRYAVLSRDRFRCVLCGASPATDLACKLHVDHIVPFSKGGRTVLENLRTTCEHCNLGKGNKTG